jgi:hypothetical protein
MPPSVTRKFLATAGVRGQLGFVVAATGRPGQIDGTLIGSGNSVSAANSSLSAYENPIDEAIVAGKELAWTDDVEHSGQHLVLLALNRIGPRVYGRRGTTVEAWQRYSLSIVENRPTFA